MSEQEKSISQSNEEIESLRDYRESVINQILDDEKEYHTTITYIAAGALALFLTINEKFFNIIQSQHLWIFIASLSMLFATLVLYIVNIVYDISAHETMRDTADKMLKDKNYDKPNLLSKWEGLISKSRWLMYLRMVMLVLGIFLEVWFILANMTSKKSADKSASKVEINLSSKDSTEIVLDTSKVNVKIDFIHQ